jgi:hypothetical protein
MIKLIVFFTFLTYTSIYSQIGSHTSREIDSLVIYEGGSISQMPVKSQKRQKEWQIINKNYFSSEIARYKLIKTNLIEGKEENRKVYIFSHTHCWKRPLGCNYLVTENKFIISED